MKDRKKSRTKKSLSALLAIGLLFCGPLLSQQALAQNNIPILSWRTHFSYSNVKTIASSENKVFAATENAIFYYDLEDNSLNLINKNTGLSGVGIGTISFDPASDQLIIAYDNGNIDFWSNGNINTVTTIQETQTTASKKLRDIQRFDNALYFSGNLGVVVYDIAREEITETYQNLGPNGEALIVYQTAFANDSIYAVTESGILSASLASTVNRQDFNNWNRALVGISFQHIAQSGNTIFASADSDLFTYNSGLWTFSQNFTSPISSLEPSSPTRLLVLTESELWLNNENGLSQLYDATSGQMLHDIIESNSQVWIGSSNQGLLQFNAFSAPPNSLKPAGPSADVLLSPAAFEKSIYWINEQAAGSISQFNLEDQTWTSFLPKNSNGDLISNLTDLEFGVVSENGLAAPIFSSFDQGLFSGGNTSTNSVDLIEGFPNGTPPQLSNGSFNMSSIASQGINKLWVATTERPNTLFSLNLTSNEWTSFSLTSSLARFPTNLFIAPDGSKWMSIDPSRGGGIVVFDETTGTQRNLNTNGGQGGLPGTEVTDMALDQNLFLWVGTNQGIAFFPNPSAVLDNRPLTANVPIFENRLLLRDEFITQIAIDPANRKWFGTKNNGLWLFSETGEALVYHFTIDNSPLPSNQIISLYLDPPSGELFIGTDKGTVSFRSDATEGTNQHTNVEIYPNPVNPSFQGNIVINGLANSALVKITDVSGKLVREVRANGSTSLWNSRDINGTRVKSGVYLVFSSNSDGTETFVGKIVVI